MAGTYEKILKATTELVNKKSYHGTSLEMIAAKANISKSTIFYYFKSKEGVILTLFEEALRSVRKQASLILNDKNLTGKEKLRKWMHSYLSSLETHGDILKIYLGDSRFISKESKAAFEESQRGYVNLIATVIRQIQEEDKQAFNKLDPKIVAHSIFGMYNAVVNWFDFNGKLSTEELANSIYEMVSGSFQQPKTAWKKTRAAKQKDPTSEGPQVASLGRGYSYMLPKERRMSISR